MRNIHYTIITLYNYQYYRIWKFYMNIIWIYTTTKKYICNIYIYIYIFILLVLFMYQRNVYKYIENIKYIKT